MLNNFMNYFWGEEQENQQATIDRRATAQAPAADSDSEEADWVMVDGTATKRPCRPVAVPIAATHTRRGAKPKATAAVNVPRTPSPVVVPAPRIESVNGDISDAEEETDGADMETGSLPTAVMRTTAAARTGAAALGAVTTQAVVARTRAQRQQMVAHFMFSDPTALESPGAQAALAAAAGNVDKAPNKLKRANALIGSNQPKAKSRQAKWKNFQGSAPVSVDRKVQRNF